MINFAIYLLELVSVILIIHVVFQSRFRWDFAVVVLSFVSIVTLFLAYYMQIQFITYITQFAIYLYCLYEFRKSWVETLLRFACAIAQIAILETIFQGQFFVWYQKIECPLYIYLGINSVLLICSLGFYYFFIVRKMCFYIELSDKTFIVLVIVVNLIIFYVKDDKNGRALQLAIFVISCVLLMFRFIMIANKEERKKKQTYEDEKWLKQYTVQYEALIQEVRRRQHDYKNEIQTIKMACATGVDEVTLDVIRECEEAEQYTGILNGCENPIIAGLVYSKVREFENQGVATLCRVQMRNSELSLEIREVIDIIGILLDNAFECTSKQEKKKMKFDIKETEKGLLLSTCNPSPYISYSEILEMFEAGFSTKGKNRGIGLHTVRQFVKKCHGEIITSNQTFGDDNYFNMQIIIPFRKK